MSKVIYFVRHGLTDWVGKAIAGRTPGVHLNESGLEQARALADWLRSERISAVCSSPLERARETAEPLASRLQMPLRVCEEFNEIDFGDWTGRRLAELDSEPAWKQWNQQRSQARAPNGESMAEAQTRVLRGIERLHALELREAVVVVSHADTIKCVVMHYLGLSLDRFWTFEISPASITTVAVESWGGRVLSLNVESATGRDRAARTAEDRAPAEAG